MAARKALSDGADVEFDLLPGKRLVPGRSGLSVHGQARLLSEEDRRFAAVFVTDQSEYARMEATRRDFVANVSHELKTPVGAMAVLAEALLVTALANLVSNAIAYSPRGSLVSISRRRRGDNIEIAVTDRGIGIARKDQERVFERFFRADKARSRATGGTGLGLAIVKHVVNRHRGRMVIESVEGKGTTVTVWLPSRGTKLIGMNSAA